MFRHERAEHYANTAPPSLAELERQARRVRLHWLLMWACSVPVAGWLVYLLLTV